MAYSECEMIIKVAVSHFLKILAQLVMLLLLRPVLAVNETFSA